jgi:hypothetical protein
MSTLPGQGQVDPSQIEMPDPNLTLFSIIKDTYRREIKPGRKIPANVLFDTKWFTGGATPEVHIRLINEKVERWAAGSTKRLHFTFHDVWIWSRAIDERWQLVKAIERVLALKAVKPSKDIERIDYWNVSYWQEEDPQGAAALFRAKINVQTIWIK